MVFLVRVGRESHLTHLANEGFLARVRPQVQNHARLALEDLVAGLARAIVVYMKDKGFS